MEIRNPLRKVTMILFRFCGMAVAFAVLLSGCGGDGGGKSSASAQLVLTGSNPRNGATDVQRAIVPVLSFSKQLDTSSVTAGTVTLRTASELHPISATISGNEITITPVSNLEPLTTYTLTLEKGIRAADGSQLESAIALMFSTRDRTWKPLELVGSAPLGIDTWGYYFGAVNVGLTVLETGSAHVAWLQQDAASNFNMLRNSYEGVSGWDVPELIQADGHTVENRELTNDRFGNVIAIWQTYDSGTIDVHTWVDLYRPGRGWTGAAMMNDERGGFYAPQAAVDAAGNAFVVWPQNGVTYTRIWAARYVENSGWSNAQTIDTDAGSSLNPRIAVDGSGNAVAIWQQDFRIRSNWYVQSIGWHTTVTVDDGTAAYGVDAEIAVDPNGTAIAIWEQTTFPAGVQPKYEVWSGRFTTGGAWDVPQRLSNNVRSAVNPAIEVNANGSAIAAWVEFDSTQIGQCWARFYHVGTNWSTATLLSGTAAASDPLSVAIDSNGNALTLWTQATQSPTGISLSIWGNRFTSVGQWGVPLILASEASSDTGPRLAFDSKGNATAVWSMFDGAREGIWSRRFD